LFVLRQERVKEELTRNGCCVVCMDAPRDCAVMPCGHVCLCSQCLPSFQAASLGDVDEGDTSVGRCPICRAEISQVTRLFF